MRLIPMKSMRRRMEAEGCGIWSQISSAVRCRGGIAELQRGGDGGCRARLAMASVRSSGA